MNVFDRYAPFIQDYIYRSGWAALRGVQNAAGEAIFGTRDNVLLTASTASGKTEAAFFPILTLMDEDPPKADRALRRGGDPGDPLARRRPPVAEAEAAAEACWDFADHPGVPRIADDQ